MDAAVENAIFVPSVPATSWTDDVLPGKSASALPIAGRRYIDYAMEYCHDRGITMMEVLDWRPDAALAQEFSDPERTGYAVFYIPCEGEIPRGLSGIEKMHTPLTEHIEDGTALAWGLCLPSAESGEASFEELAPGELADTPIGIYRRSGGRWMRRKPCASPIANVKDWHRANFAVLNSPGTYALPGYSAEKGVYLGRNVVMERGTDAKTPVLLQDDVWCERDVRLEGDVIVGRGSCIREGARLRRTVVGDDTYVGMDLDLDGKIVIGRRVIDAQTGAWIDMEEPGLAHEIGGTFRAVVAKVWKTVKDFLAGRSKGGAR